MLVAEIDLKAEENMVHYVGCAFAIISRRQFGTADLGDAHEWSLGYGNSTKVKPHESAKIGCDAK